MTNRVTAALVAMLISAGTALAQTPPAEVLPGSPTRVIERTDIASFIPADVSPGGDYRVWATGEYLAAWFGGANVPALATTSVPGTPRNLAGIQGATGSSNLFEGPVNDAIRSGIRFNAGVWCDPGRIFGIEAGFLMIESQAAILSNASTDGTILARPFIDATTGLAQAVLVAFPGSSNGSIDIRVRSGNLYEFHLDLTEKALDKGWFRLDSILGYRYYRYDEGVRIQQTITTTDPNFIPGTQIVSNDNFNTRNEFHGVDMGFRSHFLWNSLSVELLTKVAVGRVNRTLVIEGDQTISVPGADPVSTNAGVFALASNSGTRRFSDWKAMPEAGVALNWQMRPNMNLRLGYSFLLLNGVARAADQIDTTVNPDFFPGGNQSGTVRPAFNQQRSDMWIQTLNVGLLFTY